ncbi:MAG: ATP-binding protein [Candidatus Hydrogenedentes bacterium]|nr:ATP-binding protein [Candidatus Hydrogenedentota bacterium]
MMQKRNRPRGKVNDESLARLLDEANELGAFQDVAIQGYVEAAAASPDDPVLQEILEQSLHPFRVRQIVDPDPLRPYPGPETGLDQGDIEFGGVNETALPWRVDLQSLPHTLVVGPTRGGKTSLIVGILEQLSGSLPFMYITWKTDAARLLVDPPIVRRAFLFDELRISPFTPPPGTDRLVWGRLVIELVCAVFGLQYSRALIVEFHDALQDLYEKYSQTTGTTTAFTFHDLREMTRRKKSKYSEGLQAALDRLITSTGSVFDCSAGMDISSALLRDPSLVMIPNVHDECAARFVVDFLMEYAHAFFLKQGPNDGSPQFGFFLDDAHRFLSQSAERSGLTPLSHRYLIVGQAGLRLIVASQCPSDLALPVSSQSGIVVQVGAMGHTKDLQAVGNALGLPQAHWERLERPARGEFVARENLGRYAKPFGGMVRRLPSPTVAFTDADRKRLMDPVVRSLVWRPGVPLDVVERAMTRPASGAVPARMPGAVSARARALAMDILTHPWDLLMARYARMNCTGGTAQRTKDELIQLGWVKEHAISQHGMAPIVLEPTSLMAAAVGRPLPSFGKGGFLHAFVQELIARRLTVQRYAHVRKERFYGSKAVDVVAQDTSGGWVAVEVTISLTNVVDNVEKDFLVKPDWLRLHVVCLDVPRMNQAQRAIALAPGVRPFLTRIRTETVATYL